MSEKESNNLRQKRSLAEKASEISQVQESIAGDDISDAGVDVGVDVGVGVGVDDDNEERFGWVVVVAAFFVQAIIVGTITNYGVYQDRYETHEYAAANSFQISLVGTLAVVGMNTLGLFTGQVADYLGYRISAFISGISMSVCLIATSFSTEIWQLYIFQGYLYGASASLAFFPSVSLPSQWFKRRRGFAMGIVVAGGGVGGLILSPVIAALFESIGYRWTVRVVALLHLIIIIPSSMFFKSRVESGRDRSRRLKLEMLSNEKPQDQPLEEGICKEELLNPPEKKSGTVDFSALKDKNLVLLMIIVFFSSNGYFIPFYFFPTYARTHGVSVSTASLLIGILNGFSASGRVIMGIASDHIGDVNILLISTVLSSLSIFVVWSMTGTSVTTMVVFCVVYGFFSGSYISIVPTVVAHINGTSRLASVIAMVYVGLAAGSLIGSPVGGALLDLSDGSNYIPTLLWGGSVFMMGGVLTLILKLKMNPKFFRRV